MVLYATGNLKLDVLDLRGRERGMFDHRAGAVRAPVEQILVSGVHILQQVLLDDPFVERRAGHGTVNQSQVD